MFVHRGVTPLSERGLRPSRRCVMWSRVGTIRTCDEEVAPQLDKADAENAIGYHETDSRGIPNSFVVATLRKELKTNWTVTLSHEALKQLGGAQNNLLVQALPPEDSKKEVVHWFEMWVAMRSLTSCCRCISPPATRMAGEAISWAPTTPPL